MMNAYRQERAQDLLDERIACGVFKCDRCDLIKPLPFSLQEGHQLCRRCVDPLSNTEAQRLSDEAESMLPQITSGNLDEQNPYQPQTAFAGVSVVTGISPTSLVISPGGASGEIVLTGVNFTDGDEVEASDASITVTPSVDSTTEMTLTISAAGGMTPGDYNLLFSDSTLTPRGILKVR